ncbi:MAG TPA: alkaline phosphatase family protein [Sphingomicrobium sp.]|nr:alkaline phosphatase family protein [Sphingomicrobium sp.]
MTAIRKLIAAAAAAFLACPAFAQQPPPPKLLVVISVDQFSADLFDEYRPQFSAGLARLASGTVFDKAYQSHANTETCPGHSTILTGDHPSRTGIIGNIWIDQSVQRPDKVIYCSEDPQVPGTSHSHYTVSSMNLRVPTLGELMKAEWPSSRNVAVAGKDRAAVMMGGHRADQRWYWTGKQFSSDLGGVPTPATIAATNAVVGRMLAAPFEGLEPTPLCSSKAQAIPVQGHAPVGAGTFARAGGDVDSFDASPQFDGAILAAAAGLVREMRLGQGNAPDVLSVGLSATDYVGHDYGTEGQEMCLNMLELDREIGDFLGFLDSTGVDYAVALTADHGGQDLPERLKLHGAPDAQRVDPALGASAMGKAIGARFGLAGPVLLGDVSGDIYVDRSLSAVDQARVLSEAMAEYRAHPQVAAVFTHDELARTPVPTSSPDTWSLLQRARASFDPQRSGDFIVILKQHVTPIGHVTKSVATHGSPYDYDRRVPIIFWRGGFRGATITAPTDTVDIMPTLAALIGLPLAPGSVDGHCLDGTPAFCPH